MLPRHTQTSSPLTSEFEPLEGDTYWTRRVWVIFFL